MVQIRSPHLAFYLCNPPTSILWPAQVPTILVFVVSPIVLSNLDRRHLYIFPTRRSTQNNQKSFYERSLKAQHLIFYCSCNMALIQKLYNKLKIPPRFDPATESYSEFMTMRPPKPPSLIKYLQSADSCAQPTKYLIFLPRILSFLVAYGVVCVLAIY